MLRKVYFLLLPLLLLLHLVNGRSTVRLTVTKTLSSATNTKGTSSSSQHSSSTTTSLTAAIEAISASEDLVLNTTLLQDTSLFPEKMSGITTTTFNTSGTTSTLVTTFSINRAQIQMSSCIYGCSTITLQPTGEEKGIHLIHVLPVTLPCSLLTCPPCGCTTKVISVTGCPFIRSIFTPNPTVTVTANATITFITVTTTVSDCMTTTTETVTSWNDFSCGLPPTSDDCCEPACPVKRRVTITSVSTKKVMYKTVYSTQDYYQPTPTNSGEGALNFDENVPNIPGIQFLLARRQATETLLTDSECSTLIVCRPTSFSYPAQVSDLSQIPQVMSQYETFESVTSNSESSDPEIKMIEPQKMSNLKAKNNAIQNLITHQIPLWCWLVLIVTLGLQF